MDIPHLVSPGWLHANLSNPAIRVIENAWDKTLYQKGHIPGAIPTTLHPHLKHFDSNGNKTPHLLTPEEFAAFARTMGLNPDVHFVVYDDWHGLFSARFWWVCRYYGVDNISVLDGGWLRWVKSGMPTTTQTEGPGPCGEYRMPSRPEIRIDYQELLASLTSPELQIWDTRRAAEFSGEEQTANIKQGHIPGAVNLSWTELLTDQRPDGSAVLKTPEELVRIVDDLGLNRDRSVILYCQSGIRAAFCFFILALLGYSNLRLYDSSMYQWANRDNSPVRLGSRP